MSFSISDVSYAYPIAPTIGTDDIAKVTISGDSIEAICEAYNNLFSNYAYKLYGKNDEDKKNLQHYVGTILGKQNFSLDDEIKDIEEFIADIFDKDEILSKNSNAYTECKEGLKAYKFYLKEVLTNLYNLKQAIEDAQNTIGILYTLECATEEELNNVAHKLITDLQCYDKQAQDLIKAFTEYSVIKTLNVTKCITYNDGESDHLNEQTDQRTYECIETDQRSFDNLIEKTNDCKNIKELRAIQTAKKKIDRKYSTFYYKTDPESGISTLADKYDLLAQIKSSSRDENEEALRSDIGLFDELTLLEKLQYIRIYYSDTTHVRYVFPENKAIGYPCIPKQESTDALNDTKEIGQVEMFYLGYVVNRDGPINALASFLEIKVTAIKSQIKVLMERIKAIKAYSTLLQKGFEQFSSVATDYGTSNGKSIPKAAFYIYRYLSTSATRCFYYVDGEPYIMVQYSHANEGEFCKDTIKVNGKEEGKGTDSIESNDWNVSPTNRYILVKPTEEGLNTFVNFLNNLKQQSFNSFVQGTDKHDRILDVLFSNYNGNNPSDNGNSCEWSSLLYFHPFFNNFSDEILTDNNGAKIYSSFSIRTRVDIKFPLFELQSPTEWETFQAKGNGWYATWKTFNFDEISSGNLGNNVLFMQAPAKKELLPKKLDVPKIASTNMTDVYWMDGTAWNDLTPDNAEKKAVLVGYFGQWQNSYETQIANYKTNLEQQEKEITTLQKKIQTFDATSTNFRNKAFTVYNKIVNKIK